MNDLMEEVLKLISDNKEWLFSGLGIAILSFLTNFIWKKKKKDNSKTSQSTTGSKSPNINIGGDAKDVKFDFSEKKK